MARSCAAPGTPMLLDLHNLHANAHNFGFDAVEYLDSLPLQAIRQVHIAGGRQRALSRRSQVSGSSTIISTGLQSACSICWPTSPRRPSAVDDHAGARRPLPRLPGAAGRAGSGARRRRRRTAQEGRARRTGQAPTCGGRRVSTNEERLEAVLARLYTDEAYRTAFLASPEEAARAEGLDATDCEGARGDRSRRALTWRRRAMPAKGR